MEWTEYGPRHCDWRGSCADLTLKPPFLELVGLVATGQGTTTFIALGGWSPWAEPIYLGGILERKERLRV